MASPSQVAANHTNTAQLSVTVDGSSPLPLSSTTAGSLLILAVAAELNTTTFDNLTAFSVPAGWTQIGTTLHDTFAGSYMALYYRANNPGGITSVAISDSGGKTFFWDAQIYEVPGVAATTPLDGNGSAQASSVTLAVSTSGSTAQATDFVIAVYVDENAPSTAALSVPSGYTAASAKDGSTGVNGPTMRAFYKNVLTTGTQSATVTESATSRKQAFIAAFYAPGDTSPPAGVQTATLSQPAASPTVVSNPSVTPGRQQASLQQPRAAPSTDKSTTTTTRQVVLHQPRPTVSAQDASPNVQVGDTPNVALVPQPPIAATGQEAPAGVKAASIGQPAAGIHITDDIVIPFHPSEFAPGVPFTDMPDAVDLTGFTDQAFGALTVDMDAFYSVQLAGFSDEGIGAISLDDDVQLIGWFDNGIALADQDKVGAPSVMAGRIVVADVEDSIIVPFRPSDTHLGRIFVHDRALEHVGGI